MADSIARLIVAAPSFKAVNTAHRCPGTLNAAKSTGIGPMPDDPVT